MPGSTTFGLETAEVDNPADPFVFCRLDKIPGCLLVALGEALAGRHRVHEVVGSVALLQQW